MIISAVIPAVDRGGGCLALHRHFIERDDFDFAVASMYPLGEAEFSQFPIQRFSISAFFRFFQCFRLAENVNYFLAEALLPRGLLTFVREWAPTVIFSVVDDFHTPIAMRIARRLNIPLVVNFQDLFACSRFLADWRRPYNWLTPRLLSRYRNTQSVAEGVLHTSLGMKRWFGAQARGEILYPIGGEGGRSRGPHVFSGARRRLVYAGNCYGPYGEMILQLAERLENHPGWDLEVYAMGNDWPEESVAHFAGKGTYRGYLPFLELRLRLENADVLLAAMSFHSGDRTFMETSFTTKIIDYLSLARPIVVWAPAYSTAAHFAVTTRAAILVGESDAGKVVESLEQFALGSPSSHELMVAASDAAEGVFHMNHIHKILKTTIQSVIGTMNTEDEGPGPDPVPPLFGPRT